MFQNLGRALAQLRELKGLSQAALARQTGMGKGQISKYERGKELPKLDSLEKILQALEVSPHQFFYLFYLVDTSAAMLVEGKEAWSGEMFPRSLLLSQATDEALSKIFADCAALARCVFEEQALLMRRKDRIQMKSGSRGGMV